LRLDNVKYFECENGVITVNMAYLGKILSVNHWKVNKYYTHPRTKQWMADLTFIIRSLTNKNGIIFKPPVTVTIDGVFKDKRSMPDLHNFKCIPDAIQEAIGINDRDFKVETGQPGIGEPEIKITVSNETNPNKQETEEKNADTKKN